MKKTSQVYFKIYKTRIQNSEQSILQRYTVSESCRYRRRYFGAGWRRYIGAGWRWYFGAGRRRYFGAGWRHYHVYAGSNKSSENRTHFIMKLVQLWTTLLYSGSDSFVYSELCGFDCSPLSLNGIFLNGGHLQIFNSLNCEKQSWCERNCLAAKWFSFVPTSMLYEIVSIGPRQTMTLTKPANFNMKDYLGLTACNWQ